MKHENDERDMTGYLHVVRIYIFMEEIKLYVRAWNIFSLVVKSKNNIFTKEIDHVLYAFIAW